MFGASPSINQASSAFASTMLAPQSDCDGEKFQTLWMQLPEAGQISLSIKPNW